MAFALTETQLATPLPRVRWPRQRLATLNDALASSRICAPPPLNAS